MPYCPNCGATVTDDQQKCESCGTRLIEKEKKEGFFGFLFFGIIALFIPILGYILAALMKISRPKTRKFTLIVSTVGLLLWLALILIIVYIGLDLLIQILGGTILFF